MATAPTSRYHQLTVEIEHCVACEEHIHITHHDASKYEDYAKKVQEAVLAVVPGAVNVLVNPAPDLGRKGQLHFQEDPYCHHFYIVKDLAGTVLQKFRYPQLGSFEVYLHNPFVNQKLCVFSKLTLGRWPNADTVAARIERALGAGPSVSFFLFNESQLSAAALRPASQKSTGKKQLQGHSGGPKARRGQPTQKRLPEQSAGSKDTDSFATQQDPQPSTALGDSTPAEPTIKIHGSSLTPVGEDVPTSPQTVEAAETAVDLSDTEGKKKKKKKKDKLHSSSNSLGEEEQTLPAGEAPKKKKKKKNKDGGQTGNNSTGDDTDSGVSGSELTKEKKKKKKKGNEHGEDVFSSETEQSYLAPPGHSMHSSEHKKSHKKKQLSTDSLAPSEVGNETVEKQISSGSVQGAGSAGETEGHKKSKKKKDGEEVGKEKIERQISSSSLQGTGSAGEAEGHKKSKKKNNDGETSSSSTLKKTDSQTSLSSSALKKTDSGVETKKTSKPSSRENIGSPAIEEAPALQSRANSADGKEVKESGEDNDTHKEAEAVLRSDSRQMVTSDDASGVEHKKDKKKKDKVSSSDHVDKKGKEGHGDKHHKEGKKKKEADNDGKTDEADKTNESSDALNHKKKGKKHDKHKDNHDSSPKEGEDHTNSRSGENGYKSKAHHNAGAKLDNLCEAASANGEHEDGEIPTNDELGTAPPPSGKEKKNRKKDKGGSSEGGSDGEKKKKKEKEGEQTSEDLNRDKPGENQSEEEKAVVSSAASEGGEHPRAPVTKEYELLLPIGSKKTQKLSYENPGDQPRNFRLVSSDPSAMAIKSPEVTVEPRGKVKLGLTFSEVWVPAKNTYYLYIYDKDTDELQECVQIKAEYAVGNN